MNLISLSPSIKKIRNCLSLVGPHGGMMTSQNYDVSATSLFTTIPAEKVVVKKWHQNQNLTHCDIQGRQQRGKNTYSHKHHSQFQCTPLLMKTTKISYKFSRTVTLHKPWGWDQKKLLSLKAINIMCNQREGAWGFKNAQKYLP